MKAIPDNDYEKAVEERLQQHAQQDAEGMAAAKSALPGPLRDAFALNPNIQVGEFSVRPFYDADFEFLSWLNHPMAGIGPQFLLGNDDATVAQKFEAVVTNIIPSGPSFWQLAWLLTRDVMTCDAEFKKGVESVRTAARLEFGAMRSGALRALHLAVFQQFNSYWSTTLDYSGPTLVEDGKEAANAAVPPSGQPPTGSAGCSTSAAA